MPTVSWSGIRVTLGCGHMDLRQPDAEQRKRWVIGALTACWVCPKRKRAGAPGTVAAVRQIVNVEPVTAPRKPEHLGSEHWFWDGVET